MAIIITILAYLFQTQAASINSMKQGLQKTTHTKK